MSARLRREKAQQAKEMLALLCERFPNCFVLFQRRRRPLKVGVHNDIIAALPDMDRLALSIALRRYTSNPFYRQRLRADAMRIDLNGAPAGAVEADWVDLRATRPTDNASPPTRDVSQNGTGNVPKRDTKTPNHHCGLYAGCRLPICAAWPRRAARYHFASATEAR
jgi:sRNA-binding protein